MVPAFHAKGRMMPIQNPVSDLARVKSQEAEDAWPTLIEIVAYFGEGRKGKTRRIEIPADQFFGRGTYGAPMSGDQLVGMINRLRKQ
jgi:hypothetical protein